MHNDDDRSLDGGYSSAEEEFDKKYFDDVSLSGSGDESVKSVSSVKVSLFVQNVNSEARVRLFLDFSSNDLIVDVPATLTPATR